MTAAPSPVVAVVTGAGRGIGRATARRLRSDGMTVIAVARSEQELRETSQGDPGIIVVTADIAVEDEIENLAETATTHGRLAVWVNNAAILEKATVADLTLDLWERTLAINLTGAFLGCRAAFRRMAAGPGGVIINIASLSGVANVEKFPGLAAYNVSKAGVIALSEAMALEGLDSGVRCVALSPGAVDTAMLRRAAPHLSPGTTPDDIAAIVAFLTTPAAAPLSGTNIPIFSNRMA
jgi:NAD(P)-dependent dehydrogenase (short-subunit alcohol dehydrogenase family)